MDPFSFLLLTIFLIISGLFMPYFPLQKDLAWVTHTRTHKNTHRHMYKATIQSPDVHWSTQTKAMHLCFPHIKEYLAKEDVLMFLKIFKPIVVT